ncbi:MAG: preprotein translocase subunit SecE [Deltaproteobacteria bacterium]|nr:preprotein translocase subunit SecE [Deltaproteobacteria bacterium]
MTNNRIVAFSYVVLALLAGIFLEHVLLGLFSLTSVTQPLTSGLFGTDNWSWASIIGLVLAAGIAFWAWTNATTHTYADEIVAELRKVTWPTLEETRAATIAVIVASLIAAVLLGTFDVAWRFLTDKIQNPTL